MLQQDKRFQYLPGEVCRLLSKAGMQGSLAQGPCWWQREGETEWTLGDHGALPGGHVYFVPAFNWAQAQAFALACRYYEPMEWPRYALKDFDDPDIIKRQNLQRGAMGYENWQRYLAGMRGITYPELAHVG